MQMKKTIAALAAAAAMSVFADMKVGVVDMMLLVKNHPGYEANKTLLTNTEKDYKKRLETMKTELEAIQEEGRKLADELRNPMLSAAAKTKAESDIAGVQTRFMQQQQKMRNEALRNQQELSDLESRLLKAQADDLRKRIAVFASKNGYDLILDSTAALFAKDMDVTDGVLKAMDVDPKAARAAAEDEGK
jgi:Skp family chaperone for outer membrane proteins